MTRDMSGENNPRWNGGKSGGYILKLSHAKCILDFCKICSATKNLIPHHIDENRTNNSRKNLMCVCKSCHAKIHKREKNILQNPMWKIHQQKVMKQIWKNKKAIRDSSGKFLKEVR